HEVGARRLTVTDVAGAADLGLLGRAVAVRILTEADREAAGGAVGALRFRGGGDQRAAVGAAARAVDAVADVLGARHLLGIEGVVPVRVEAEGDRLAAIRAARARTFVDHRDQRVQARLAGRAV